LTPASQSQEVAAAYGAYRPGAPAMHDALVMTDYGFLLALALALLIAVDPLELDLERMLLIKHAPMLITLPSVLLAVAGKRIFHERMKHAGAIRTMAPLLTLAAIVIGGGLYARFALGIQNSFLVGGVYMGVAPMACAILLRCDNPLRLLHAYVVMLMVASVVVFAGLAINYGVRQVYHELEYLFPSLAVFCVFAARKAWQRRTGLLFFLLLAFLFKKNTGYLAGLLALVYLLRFYVWPRWALQDGIRRMTMMHWTAIALLVCAALASYVTVNRTDYLPSGNPAFRLLTYERAWQRFHDSPLWGNWFTAPGSEKFTGFDTGVSHNILPTHSDVLDLLANGGVMAMALLLWALWRVARLAYGTALRPEWASDPLTPYAHMLTHSSIVGVVTYSFNPILLQPGKAFLLWANLGFLAGISLIVKHRHRRTS